MSHLMLLTRINLVIRKDCVHLHLEIFLDMTERYKRYRLTSMEEPTDEMLHALMEDVVKAARESSANAEAEKRRRFSEVVNTINLRRSRRKQIVHG